MATLLTPEDEDDVLTSWALRFDGWKYSEHERFDHVAALDRAVDHAELPDSPYERLTLFFMLQRGLFKWGLEQEPKNGRCWQLFRELFLLTWKLTVPVEYRHNDRYGVWEAEYAGEPKSSVRLIESIHRTTDYAPMTAPNVPKRDAPKQDASSAVDINAYRASVEHYKQNWLVLDETLLSLCRERPDHSTAASVNAKLWIIGRTYATGIERRVTTTGKQGSSMSQVATHFLANSTELEAMFNELRAISEPLDPMKLRLIVSLHGRLVTMLGKITKGKAARSFASKYLHFHNPVVPIYDSVAAAVLPSLVRWSTRLAVFDLPADADEIYGWYVMRLFKLYEMVAAEELPLNVKYLDNYLLWIADETRSRVIEPPDA